MAGLKLQTAVRYVRGVGPARSQQLERAGLWTVRELLFRRPIRYQDLPAHQPLSECAAGQTACIAGEVTEVRLGGGWRRPCVVAQVRDGQEHCRITWFNIPHLKSKLSPGMFVVATGKVQAAEDGGAQMTNPAFECFDQCEDMVLPQRGRLRPVYPASGTLASRHIDRLIQNCLAELDLSGDYLPPDIRRRWQLLEHPQALTFLHRPPTPQDAEQARRRLAFDELLRWQIEFARARRVRQHGPQAPRLRRTAEIDRRIRNRLPFQLTAAQNRCIEEVCRDLDAAQPMLRLLQGDVGSGKTVVAVYAALVCVANQFQAALLAPTEILARQHHDKIQHYLKHSAVRVGLAIGRQPDSQKLRLRSELQSGDINLVVGTHALLDRGIRFHRLGLTLIDEQQRFGVQQRRELITKGRACHYLVLSATPIPRTQALATVGDLDVSILDQGPGGPRRVHTCLVGQAQAPSAWRTIRRDLDAGRQAYVVLPLVEESEKLGLKAVTTEIEHLGRTQLQGYRCAVLHGRMPPAEKEQVVSAFRDGRIQVLVCTTVVEVGVDIPNATTMAIFHPERYGLAQLHQLRGRIGRGGDQASLFLFTHNAGGKSAERLKLLCRTMDGFEIADADLRLRGPGDILGTEQHGLPMYRFTDLGTDGPLLRAAQHTAAALLAGDITLNASQKRVWSELVGQPTGAPGHIAHVA